MRALFMGFFLYLIAVAAVRAEAPVFRREPVTVVTATGETEFSAEIAETDAQQEYGLMFRYTLPPDRAMLFDFGRVRKVAMWMKNTYIPLDMVFIRADGAVSSVAESTVPHSLEVIASQEPVLAVLELAAGTARRIGLKPGDKVYHRIFKPAP